MSAVLTWTRMFSPTVVNEVRIGYTRVGIDEGVPVDWSGLLGSDGNAKFGIAGGQPYRGSQSVSSSATASAASAPAPPSAARSTTSCTMATT